jgi:AcrR family transcriptional regulator
MTRTRLTREESRDLTRQRLLDAALKVIAQKGLAAASVEDIALAAGYTRGAFYSNFGSKNDLFIELLRRDHDLASQDFDVLLTGNLSLEQIRLRMRERYSQLYRDEDCFMNWTEARLLATRDPEFRTKFSALLAEKRAQTASYVEFFCQRAGVVPPAAPELIAMGLMSLIEGTRLFMLSTSLMQPEDAEAVLGLFIDSIMELVCLRGVARPD